MIDTTSQATIQNGLRAYLLDTPGRSGATLRSLIGERLFWDRAPDVVAPGPYIVAQLAGVPPDPAYSDERITPDLTLQVIARATADAPTVSTAGDVVAQLMRGVLSEATGATGGLVWARSHYRSSVPRPETGPAAALTIEYHRTSLVIWPAYLYRGE